jgi:hypothetical protein
MALTLVLMLSKNRTAFSPRDLRALRAAFSNQTGSSVVRAPPNLGHPGTSAQAMMACDLGTSGGGDDRVDHDRSHVAVGGRRYEAA